MRDLIANADLKRVAQGVSAACVAGLLLGAAMQPNLRDDTLRGPQQLVSGGGARSPTTAAEFAVGAYGANPPDYVIGTDWTRPRTIETAAYEPPPVHDDNVELTADVDPPTVRAVRADWREPPTLPRNYPSSEGGVVYDSGLGEPPPPPTADDDPAG